MSSKDRATASSFRPTRSFHAPWSSSPQRLEALERRHSVRRSTSPEKTQGCSSNNSVRSTSENSGISWDISARKKRGEWTKP